MTRVVMVIAIGLRHSMMCIRLVVLELIGVVLSERRVEVLLLIDPIIMSIESSSDKGMLCILFAQ
jgi:hypothetical protein